MKEFCAFLMLFASPSFFGQSSHVLTVSEAHYKALQKKFCSFVFLSSEKLQKMSGSEDTSTPLKRRGPYLCYLADPAAKVPKVSNWRKQGPCNVLSTTASQHVGVSLGATVIPWEFLAESKPPV